MFQNQCDMSRVITKGFRGQLQLEAPQQPIFDVPLQEQSCSQAAKVPPIDLSIMESWQLVVEDFFTSQLSIK